MPQTIDTRRIQALRRDSAVVDTESAEQCKRCVKDCYFKNIRGVCRLTVYEGGQTWESKKEK